MKLEKQKILIVDDMNANLMTLKMVMKNLDAELFFASSGNDALKLCLSHHFALALLDVQMPGMDGFELAEFLRSDEKTKDIPIIFLTALSTSEEHIHKGYSSGAVDYLVKPFNMDVLLSKVKIFSTLSSQKAELTMHKYFLENLVDERTKELKESEANFREFFDEDLSGNYKIRADGTLLLYNKSFVKIMGFEPKDKIINTNLYDLYKNRNNKDKILKKLKKDGKVDFFEIELKGSQGNIITALLNSIGRFNEKGELVEIFGYLFDVTDRKKAESELVKLSRALEQSPTSVFITNNLGEIEYFNPAFLTQTQYKPEEIIGKRPNILKAEEQDSVVFKELWSKITKGKIWRGELVNKRKDGTNYLVEANISPVKNKTGDITHFIAIQEDITGKRKLERDFIHAVIEAQEIEKQAFGEDLHDGISQILSAQTMFIDVLIKLNKDRLNDKAKHLIKVRDLNLSAILEARNIAHGLMSKQLKENGLLVAVENMCIDYSTDKNIQFSFKTSNLEEEEISRDVKSNIFRIIQEITTNTIRHSLATKSSISINKIDNNSIELIVKDNGVGIDYDKIKRDGKGAGLKNIERRVILLNGKSVIDTGDQKGTKYTITAPLITVK